jgi:hypothetical protein
MERLEVAVCAALALALAPAALAKGPVEMTICGASSCTTARSESLDGRGPIDAVLSAEGMALDGSGASFASAPPPGAFYEVRLESDWTQPATRFFVPSAGLLAVGTNWIRLDPAATAAIRSAVAGIDPYPEPRLTGALVDGLPARDPGVYGALVGRLEPGDVPASAGSHVTIVLRAERGTPWTGESVALLLYAGSNVVRRNDGWYRVPPELAARIEAGAGLSAAAPEPSFSWVILASALAGGLVLLVGAILLARARAKTRHGSPPPEASRL